MKLKLLSAAVLASICGIANAQVSVYGLIDASYGKSIAGAVLGQKSDFHSGGDNGSGEGNSTTRVGIKGMSDLGGGTKANFKFETGGITSDGEVGAPGSAFFNRQAWVGLSGGMGEVRLGRQDSVPFQTMIGYDFNGASNGVSALGYSGQGPWARGRQSRSLQYISPDMGGVSLRVGFVPQGNVAGDKATTSGSITYAKGPVSVSAAFESKRTTTTSDFSSVAGSYDLGAVKLMAGYADGGKNATGTSFGAVAPVAGASLGFIYGRNSDTKGTAWEVFLNKEVFKNTYAYIEAGQADAKANLTTFGISKSGTGAAVGVIYTF